MVNGARTCKPVMGHRSPMSWFCLERAWRGEGRSSWPQQAVSLLPCLSWEVTERLGCLQDGRVQHGCPHSPHCDEHRSLKATLSHFSRPDLSGLSSPITCWAFHLRKPAVGVDRGLDSPLETLVLRVSSLRAVCSVRPGALGARGGRCMSGWCPALGVGWIELCLWGLCPSCRAGVSGEGRELRHEGGFLVSWFKIFKDQGHPGFVAIS